MSQCNDIHRLLDRKEICEFAKKYCNLESIVPYATIVYCYLQSQSVRIQLLSIGILLTSGSTGIAAFDYLSPNLTSIAEMSGLPQSLMGVTVLAFGNGSVDVFGAFVALQSNQSAMAVGEIMGGAFFVTTVVVGSMALITPFKVSNFVPKDILMLQFAICYTLLTIIDGKITALEAFCGVIGYILYSIYVVYTQLNAEASEHMFPPIPSIEDPVDPLNHLLSPRIGLNSPSDGASIFAAVRPSLYSAVDLNWNVRKRLSELANNTDYVVPRAPIMCHIPIEHPQLNSSGSSSSDLFRDANTESEPNAPTHMRRRSSAPEAITIRITDTDENTSRLPRDLPKLRIDTVFEGEQLNPLNTRNNSAHPYPMLTRQRSFQKERKNYAPYSLKSLVNQLLDVYEYEFRLSSPMLDDNNELSPASALRSPEQHLSFPEFIECEEKPSIFFAICPGLAKWKEQTWIHRIIMLPMLPVLTLLSWSVPLACNSDSVVHLCIHSLVIPFIIPILVPKMGYSFPFLLIQSLAAMFGVIWWAFLKKPTPSRLFVSTVGFFMGIMWVVLLATEFVSILTILAEVCNVSNAIMGLTVFALGDSLGDFVSNITVAQIGYPEMAVAACFGGPIFTLLIGVSGASLATMILKGQAYIEINAKESLKTCAIAILFTLTLLQIELYFNNNHIGKKIGIQLILIWFFYTGASVLLFNRRDIN